MASETSLQKQNAKAAAATAATSATAYITSLLKQFHLESLTSWAKAQLAKGYGDDYVLQQMREQQAWKDRFGAIIDRENDGLPALSPADVINFETAVTSAMVRAGMPKGFYDNPDDFRQLMKDGRSADEVVSLVQDSFVKVQQAPASVRGWFRDTYGPDGDSALASYILDPGRALPLLETQIAAAGIGGAGRQAGIGTGRGLAEELARQGVSMDQATQTFGQLAQSKGLFNEGVDEHQNLSVDVEGVQAAFGVDANARAAVSKRSADRTAAFAGAGGAQSGQKGASGLGAANQP